MWQTVVGALALLHLGPGLAFAAVAWGCEGAAPVFGSACEGSPMRFFLLLTLAVWLAGGGWLWHRHRARKAAQRHQAEILSSRP